MTDFTSSHWLWTILWTQKWLVEFPICTASTSRSSKSEKKTARLHIACGWLSKCWSPQAVLFRILLGAHIFGAFFFGAEFRYGLTHHFSNYLAGSTAHMLLVLVLIAHLETRSLRGLFKQDPCSRVNTIKYVRQIKVRRKKNVIIFASRWQDRDFDFACYPATVQKMRKCQYDKLSSNKRYTYVLLLLYYSQHGFCIIAIIIYSKDLKARIRYIKKSSFDLSRKFNRCSRTLTRQPKQPTKKANDKPLFGSGL